MEILKTTDYKMFKQMKGNRSLSQKHLKRLKKSIEENNLLHLRPILVNEAMEIVDGQHRFAICKEFKLPVYYIVGQGTLEETTLLNSNQSNWGMMDFANAYASQDKKPYIQFLKTVEQYPTIHPSVIMKYLDVRGRTSLSRATMFRVGKFEIQDLDKAIILLAQLEEIQQYTKFAVMASFGEMMRKIFDNQNYDHERFIHKLKLFPAVLEDYRTFQNFARNIEELYNFKNTGERVRLF